MQNLIGPVRLKKRAKGSLKKTAKIVTSSLSGGRGVSQNPHIIEFDIAGFAAQIFDEIEPKTAPQSPQHLKFCNNCATIFLT